VAWPVDALAVLGDQTLKPHPARSLEQLGTDLALLERRHEDALGPSAAADSLNGAYLLVEEARFDQSGIRTLYESEAFPLPRQPRPAPADNDAADAA
jgi:hypothetical protein